MPAKPERTVRVGVRISPETLKTIRRAAEIQGQSVSEFMVAAAQRAIHQVNPLELPTVPAPTAALARAFKRHRALIKPR